MIGATQPAAATREPIAREPVMHELTVLESRALLGNSREIAIRHGTETYRLKLTRHGKLILTK